MRNAEILNIYITDGIKAIAQNTANFAGGSYLNIRYADLILPSDEKEEKTQEEIVENIGNVLMNLSKPNTGGESD